MPNFLTKLLINLELKKIKRMNQNQIVNLIVPALVAATAAMAKSWGIDPASWQQDLTLWASGIIAAVLLVYNHVRHGDGTSGTVSKVGLLGWLAVLATVAGRSLTVAALMGAAVGRLLTCAALMGGAALLSGCSITKIAQSGEIISVTSRGLGVNIMMTSASTTLPEVQAGIFSQNVQMIPSSTNRLYSPDFASAATANSGYDPFSIGGNEATAAGLSSIYGAGTSNVWVQPQFPMGWPTNSLR